MNGRDFLDSARRLSTSEHASDLRSSVSRAYYACYHAALSLCTGYGIRFSKNSTESHSKMPQCFDNCNVAIAKEVGKRLVSLREDRNSADYTMTDSMTEDAGNVALRIAIADEVMEAVDQCHALPNLR